MKRVVVLAASVVMLLPLYLLLVGSVLPYWAMDLTPPRMYPWPAVADSYRYILERSEWVRWIPNTAMVTSVSCVLAVVVTGMAAYSFAYLRWPGKSAVFWLLMGGMVLPGQVLFVARFVVFQRMGLLQLPWSIILMYIGGASNVFVLRNYMRSVPHELRDMARIDGCGEWRVFLRVVLPLCAPMIAAMGLFTAIGAMGDYMWQMLVTENTVRETLVVGIMRIVKEITTQHQSSGEWLNVAGITMASGVLLGIPVLIVFLFAQRLMRGGLTHGAIM